MFGCSNDRLSFTVFFSGKRRSLSLSPNVNCYVVRMSTVLIIVRFLTTNAEVIIRVTFLCESHHQVFLDPDDDFSTLHSPGQIMTGFVLLNPFQHQELNFNVKFFDSLINLIGNATRHWKRNILIHIMVFNAGLHWQTVYYGIFECKNNCLKSIRGPFSCLFN